MHCLNFIVLINLVLNLSSFKIEQFNLIKNLNSMINFIVEIIVIDLLIKLKSRFNFEVS
jgi:hypothetical protein